MKLSCKSLGREFHAVGAEKPKLRLPNLLGEYAGFLVGLVWRIGGRHEKVVQRQA